MPRLLAAALAFGFGTLAFADAPTVEDVLARYQERTRIGPGFLTGTLRSTPIDGQGDTVRFGFEATKRTYFVTFQRSGTASLLIRHEGAIEAFVFDSSDEERRKLELGLLDAQIGWLSPMWTIDPLATYEERTLGELLCDTFTETKGQLTTSYWFSKDGLLRYLERKEATGWTQSQDGFPTYMLFGTFAFPTQRFWISRNGKTTNYQISDLRLMTAEEYESTKNRLLEAFSR